MTRPAPGCKLPNQTLTEQLALPVIEAIDHHFVESKIRSVCKPTGGVEHNRVCMRPLLPGFHTRSLVLNHIGCLAEAPVIVDWQNGETAPCIVGDQNDLPVESIVR